MKALLNKYYHEHYKVTEKRNRPKTTVIPEKRSAERNMDSGFGYSCWGKMETAA